MEQTCLGGDIYPPCLGDLKTRRVTMHITDLGRLDLGQLHIFLEVEQFQKNAMS